MSAATRPSTRCRGATVAAALALLAVLLGALLMLPPAASAQEDEPEGQIDGTIVPGTDGAAPGEVEVRLVALEGGQVAGDDVVRTEDGTFAFEVPAVEERTYILTAQYQGVQYFDEAGPIVLSPDEPEATRELTVYETTDEAPDLRILETVVALVAIDRGAGELLLTREDFVDLPGDRVFTGDGGATLRIPTPEGTTEAEGGELDGNVLSIPTALYPGENSIVTQYLVQYDPSVDEYTLRVTAPAPTGQITLRVPEGYVHRLEPLEEARAGDEYTMPELEGVVMETVVLDTPAEPGRGLLVDIIGLSGPRTTHPLTEQPGAVIAAAIAIAVIGGAVALAVIRPPQVLRGRSETGDQT